MARQPGESLFRAPVIRQEPLPAELDDGTFERQLVGFCIAALLDQRAQRDPTETRTWWAGRLGLSKSHVSKMTDLPSPSFVDQFDLAFNAVSAEYSPVQPDAEEGLRLQALLSEFYLELRPTERREPRRAVLRWMARYLPKLSPQLRRVLHESDVALERAEMLDRTREAEYDASISASVADLLKVSSGPFGGSVIANIQGAEFGLAVPQIFFAEMEKTLDTSPVGFRALRMLDRFVRVWRGLGPDPKLQRRREIDVRLAALLRRLARGASLAPYIDPYPGGEWGSSLARECLKVDQVGEQAFAWLSNVMDDPEVADRGRLYAGWVMAAHETEDGARIIHEKFAKCGSAFLGTWAQLLTTLREMAGDGADAHDTDRPSPDDLVRQAFADEYALVAHVVAQHTVGTHFDGTREALASLVFSALLTPDGRLRRALIDAVPRAGLVEQVAAILDTLLGIDEGKPEKRLTDPSQIETAIFLLGRLRQPTAARLAYFSQLSSTARDVTVVHSAIWAIGDIWRRDQSAEVVVERLCAQALDPSLGERPRIAATHVLAVIAHGEAHAAHDRDRTSASSIDAPASGPIAPTATAMLTRLIDELQASRDSDVPTIVNMILGIANWGTSFDPTNATLPETELLSGVLDGSVMFTKHDSLGSQGERVGRGDRGAQLVGKR